MIISPCKLRIPCSVLLYRNRLSLLPIMDIVAELQLLDQSGGNLTRLGFRCVVVYEPDTSADVPSPSQATQIELDLKDSEESSHFLPFLPFHFETNTCTSNVY